LKLKRLQLVLLGNGGAGKTTLKCALKKVLHRSQRIVEICSIREVDISTIIIIALKRERERERERETDRERERERQRDRQRQRQRCRC